MTDTQVEFSASTPTELPVDVSQLSATARKEMLEALREAQKADRQRARTARETEAAERAEARRIAHERDQELFARVAEFLLSQELVVTESAPEGFYRHTGNVVVGDAAYNLTVKLSPAKKRGRPRKEENGDSPDSPEGSDKPKRGRGRPRKEGAEGSESGEPQVTDEGL